MKKRIIISCIICLVITSSLILCWKIFFANRFWVRPGTEPDDYFSEKIMESVGDSFIYEGRTHDRESGWIYCFLITNHSEESIESFANVIFECGSHEKKATIIVEDGYSIYWPVFSLKNYSDDISDEISENFCYFCIKQDYVLERPFWSELHIFKYFKDIRSLTLPSEVQEKAEEEGIDWYEIWPDLEEVIVYETD